VLVSECTSRTPPPVRPQFLKIWFREVDLVSSLLRIAARPLTGGAHWLPRGSKMASDLCTVCSKAVRFEDRLEIPLRKRSTGEEWEPLIVHMECVVNNPNGLAAKIEERVGHRVLQDVPN
jgi:hypothetical protein